MTSNQNIGDIYNLLVVACKFGDLERVQELLPKVNLFSDISANDELAFISACSNGNLEIAQLLYQFKPNIDISYGDEEAFRNACENGHLEVAQWLLQIKPDINISVREEKAFHYACENGHLEVVQWLLQIKSTIDIYITSRIKIPLKITAAVEKNEHDVCCICYEYCEIETQCNHSFCKKCIAKCINKNMMSCPICRQSMENGFNIIL